MIPHILPLIPQHNVYTEIFFGGGAVFWAKDPSHTETINDRDDLVINFYRQLKNNYNPLKKKINSSLVSRSLHHEALTIIRRHRGGLNGHTKTDLAWAFWMCTNFGFSNNIGGGLRYSNDQRSSVTRLMARKKDEFTELLVARIENTVIENKEALLVYRARNNSSAFHYIDPPYPGADQGHYRGYSWQQFEELLTALGECKGKFMLSNYNSELLDRHILANGWTKLEIEKPLTANPAHYRHGKRKTEVLVMNYHNVCGTMKLFNL